MLKSNGLLERLICGSLELMMRGLKLLHELFGPEPENTRDPAAAERIKMAVAAVGANPGLSLGGPTLIMGDWPSFHEPDAIPQPEPKFPRLYVPEPGDDGVDETPPSTVERRPLRVFRPEADCA